MTRGRAFGGALTGVLWAVALVLGFACFFGWRSNLLLNELDKRVHVGLARPDVECYLGAPRETFTSIEELPDDPRFNLPALAQLRGPVAMYYPIWQARWHNLPLTDWLWFGGLVVVYYDQHGIVERVVKTNVL